jgi:hypothetical protein
MSQRLRVVLQRLLLLAKSIVHRADVVEQGGFSTCPIPHGTEDGQRLSEVLQRLLLLAKIGVHQADVVERRGFPGPIPHGAMRWPAPE